MTVCCWRPAPSRCGLPIPGADQPHVHVLRTLADCRAIIDAAKGARRAIVIGASFIGLETAAALRARDIEVHVVALEQRPMERVLGPEMGDFVRALARGSTASSSISAIPWSRSTASARRSKSGGVLEADLVVVGVGVRPRLALAEAGRPCARSRRRGERLSRNQRRRNLRRRRYRALARSAFAATISGSSIGWWPNARARPPRATCWGSASFDAVPFFWSQHYDVPINYVGHAETWDEIAIDGDIAAKDCLLQYKRNGRVLAVASIYRDLASLKAELEMERATR